MTEESWEELERELVRLANENDELRAALEDCKEQLRKREAA